MARWLYIVSAPHAGSTILDLLLGAHPQAVAVGELSHLPKNLALNSTCSCGEPVRSCPFYRPLAEKLGRALDSDLWQTPYALDLGHILASRLRDPERETAVRRGLRKLERGGWLAARRLGLLGRAPWPFFARASSHSALAYEYAAEIAGADVVADSSKELIKPLETYLRHPDKLRIIHLLRDGRGVVHSHLTRKVDIARAVRAFTASYSRSLALLGGMVRPEHVVTVHYERLVTAPEAELSRILDAVGLAYDPAMLDYGAAEHHLANGNAEAVTTRQLVLDEKWRRELDAAQLDYFERHAKDLNRALGYAD